MKSARPHPLQLHRSIIFWSGILVIGFGLWAWRDSFRYESSCVTGRLNWGNSWGGVFLMYDPSLTPDLMGSRIEDHSGEKSADPLQRPFFLRGQGGTFEQSRALLVSPSSFHDQVYRYMSYQARDVRMGFIPYWIILPGIGAVWAGLLVWRARRRKESLRVFSVQFSGKA